MNTDLETLEPAEIEKALNSGLLTKREKQDLARVLEEKVRLASLRRSTVIGFVDAETKQHTHSIKNTRQGWIETTDKPDLYLAAKLEKAVTSNKRFVVIYGGRGSGKSLGVGDICLVDGRDTMAKTYCLREFQSSIRASIHSLLAAEVDRLEFDDFHILDKTLRYKDRDLFEFAGIARNTDSIKSAHGFKNFLVEEAQFLTEESIRALTPTARNKPNKGLPGDIGEAISTSNVRFFFVANPMSQQDAFSKKFITPYLDAIERDGYYEDDLRLIIKMNHSDNPWFEESGLVEEQQDDWDQVQQGKMDIALYEHIWEGGFNDSVENALISREWFDACIDAHEALGFEPLGVRISSHDPADMGQDSKGYALRHGSVVWNVLETMEGNVNDGGHWAAMTAIEDSADYLTWDGDGMGAALAEQMSKDCEGKKITLSVFKGSEKPSKPDQLYKPALKESVQNQLSNKEVFKNQRAQYYFELRDRIYRTYRAVKFGEYHDPDTLISFSSKIELLSKLRSELCRIPRKDNRNGLNELYSKKEMVEKFQISSPNLADSVMMLMRYEPPRQRQTYRPRPIPVMGATHGRRSNFN